VGGAAVVINNDRDAETLEKQAQELRENGANVEAVVADVTNRMAKNLLRLPYLLATRSISGK
jgi:NADP-dependent 3-hydroxy acid dehydrogenase YdfG